MSKTQRGVRGALRPGSSLRDLTKDGLQALRGRDRARITADPARHVVDSLALDERPGSTGEWDYMLGVDESRRAVLGVEVHPASNGKVAEVIAKKHRTLAALQPHMTAGQIRSWIWIASGPDTVARASREFRQLIQAGIDLVGGHLSLPYRP